MLGTAAAPAAAPPLDEFIRESVPQLGSHSTRSLPGVPTLEIALDETGPAEAGPVPSLPRDRETYRR
jgi:hypothetical protein